MTPAIPMLLGPYFPPWLFVLLALMIVAGLVLMFLGRGRRRRDDDPSEKEL